MHVVVCTLCREPMFDPAEVDDDTTRAAHEQAAAHMHQHEVETVEAFERLLASPIACARAMTDRRRD